MEGEFLAALGDALLRRAALGAIMVAPAAHDVEVFQGETRGIDLRVTRGTGFQGPVLVQLLAHGSCAANVRLHRGYAGGRRSRLLAEDAFHDPGAAQDR